MRAEVVEGPARPADELLQELQVHQIELEMQNEALREAQVALEKSHDRYVDLYHFAPVGYFTLTDTGLIAEVNLTGAALLGEDRSKLLNRRFARFIVGPDDQDKWHLHLRHAFRLDDKQACELRLQRSDGTVFDAGLECLRTAVSDAAVPALRVTLTDITARKKAERANAAKSHFLAAASHDLRQPLQALRLFIDLLNQQLDDPRHLKIAQNASTALTAGEKLLEVLLQTSKIDAGFVAVQRQNVSFAEIAANLVNQCAGLAHAKGLELTVVGSSAVIDTDPVLLSRLLSNLLDNAIKYTEHGRILLGCRRIKDGVRIEVWDTGIGIAADEMPHIFDDFYRIEMSCRHQTHGHGIGLSVVRRTADLLGHQLTVESWPGRGSVFRVMAPLAQ